MRLVLSALVVAAMTAATLVIPVTDAPESRPVAAGDPPAVSICPVEEGRGRATSIDLLASEQDSGQVSAFAAGEALGTAAFEIPEDGTASIDVVDISAVGVASVLVEATTVRTGVATLSTGMESVSAESCASEPAALAVIAGGSTLSGEEFELQVMNPYSGQARLSVTAVSESGVETSQVLDEVVVQSRTSAVIDLADLLPGREQLSLILETTQGSVLTIGRFFNGTDGAVWNASAPTEDSFVLLPPGPGPKKLIVASSVSAEVSYQVDLYGPEGLVEGFAEGVLDGRGFVELDLSQVGENVAAARLLATAPIAGFVRHQTGNGVGITSGTSALSNTWLMPGAGSIAEALTTLIILNPGSEDASVTIDDHLGLTPRQITVFSDGVAAIELTNVARDGVTVRSEVPVVAMWAARAETALALSLGTPILDD